MAAPSKLPFFSSLLSSLQFAARLRYSICDRVVRLSLYSLKSPFHMRSGGSILLRTTGHNLTINSSSRSSRSFPWSFLSHASHWSALYIFTNILQHKTGTSSLASGVVGGLCIHALMRAPRTDNKAAFTRPPFTCCSDSPPLVAPKQGLLGSAGVLGTVLAHVDRLL